MHAIDWLRHLARARGADPTELAVESAYALAGLAEDRRALVLACRRMLEFHPSCGPLWWVAAHSLVANDLRAASWDLAQQLEADATADELFAFTPSGSTLAGEATPSIVRGLSDRPDITVRLVGEPHVLRPRLRAFADRSAQGFPLDETGRACDGADAVVVEAAAAGPAGYLLNDAGHKLARRAIERGIDLWVLAGVGRVLPAELFVAVVSHCDEHPDDDVGEDARLAGVPEEVVTSTTELHGQRLVPVDSAVVVITTGGPRSPKVVFHANPGISHQRCPIPDELLVPFGVAG